MAGFDLSPRATKRRKISSDEPTSPTFSRVLRTVKQAVYGKPSTPKISSEVFDEAVKRPVKAKKESPGGERLGVREGAQALVNPGQGRRLNDHTRDGDEAGQAVPTRQTSRGQRPKKGHTENARTEEVKDADVLQTPTRKKKQHYKGWVYVEGEHKLAHDEPGDPLEKDCEVGRLKRGHDDLTIDMNPRQIKPSRSHHVANGVNVGKEDSRGTATGGALRTPKKNENKEDEASSFKPVTVSGSRKKGGGRRKKAATESVFAENGGECHSDRNATTKDASPDELARMSQEKESEQESPIQTSTNKPVRKRKEFRAPSTSKAPQNTEECVVPATQDEIVLDLQTPLNDSAKALQAMLKEHPEAAGKLSTHILAGLTGKRRLPLINLEDEHQKVKQIVEQTVLAGEGNSMLVIGSRGSGKTLLVETVIAELLSDHRDDFHIVRLNGFIHTDDKLALREIWRQLGREMEVEDDDLGGRSNYADTLTSLLALLAHAATENGEEDQAEAARSVVFILDEFELFASHPRQTLLYNLFDAAQSRNAPIAVLGLTTKVNVVDSLEKRVKSRFGQRYVHLSLPRNFTAFRTICLSALKCRPTTQELLQDKKSAFQQLSTTWNDYVSALFETPQLQHFLQTLYTTTKSIPAFLNASLLPLSTLSPTTLSNPSSFTSHPLAPPDTKLRLIPALSTLSLSLLISAARLDIILDTDVCTFGMAYEEYVALASKSRMQSSAAGQMAVGGGGARIWSQELARGKWEELAGLELVVPAVGGGRGAGGRGEMWRVDVGLEEIGGVLENEGGKGSALSKWCREI